MAVSPELASKDSVSQAIFTILARGPVKTASDWSKSTPCALCPERGTLAGSAPAPVQGKQTCLENPLWEKLQQSVEYCVVFRDCCEVLPTQECLEGCPIRDIPLAVHIPMNPEEMVPEGAFALVPRPRHVSVEPGMRFVDAEAWQSFE